VIDLGIFCCAVPATRIGRWTTGSNRWYNIIERHDAGDALATAQMLQMPAQGSGSGMTCAQQLIEMTKRSAGWQA